MSPSFILNDYLQSLENNTSLFFTISFFVDVRGICTQYFVFWIPTNFSYRIYAQIQRYGNILTKNKLKK